MIQPSAHLFIAYDPSPTALTMPLERIGSHLLRCCLLLLRGSLLGLHLGLQHWGLLHLGMLLRRGWRGRQTGSELLGHQGLFWQQAPAQA